MRSQPAQTTPTRTVDGCVVDSAAAGDYPPNLYAYDGVAEQVTDLSDVQPADCQRFEELGFLVVQHGFSRQQVDDAITAIQDIIAVESTGSSIVQYESWAADRLDELNGEQKALAIRKCMNFTDRDARLATIARDPRLLSLVTRLLGNCEPEILQEMSLIKPPGGREKPWHQDRAYFNLEAGTPIVGVWIALDRATPDNGCMRVWPGRHRDGPIPHFQRRDWQICDTDMDGQQRLAVPLEPGGALLFDALLPHGTPQNETGDRRWAMQFHYCPAGATRTDDEVRMAVFGSEGKNVEC